MPRSRWDREYDDPVRPEPDELRASPCATSRSGRAAATLMPGAQVPWKARLLTFIGSYFASLLAVGSRTQVPGSRDDRLSPGRLELALRVPVFLQSRGDDLRAHVDLVPTQAV